MHRALIIPSRYAEDSGYPNQTSWVVNAELFASRLQQQGYELERLQPGADLLRSLREALRAADKSLSLLVYFAGYAVLTQEREPALVLSDTTATALRLTQLAERAGKNFGRVQFIIDAVRGTPSRTIQDALDSNQHESAEHALAALLTGLSLPDNVGMLVGVRRWGDDERSGLQVTELLDAALREFATTSDPCTSSDLAEWLEERHPLGNFALAARHTEPEFSILPRRRVPSMPHLVPPELAAPDLEHAPAWERPATSRPRLDSLPPPLPAERAGLEVHAVAASSSVPPWPTAPGTLPSGLPGAGLLPLPIVIPPPPPLPGPIGAPVSGPAIVPLPTLVAGPSVPPPPPLPVGPALGLGAATVNLSLPPPPELPVRDPLPTVPPPPTSAWPAPVSPPPPLPTLPTLAITAPPAAAFPGDAPVAIPSISPPPPLPTSAHTVPAPEPVWPQSWQVSNLPPAPGALPPATSANYAPNASEPPVGYPQNEFAELARSLAPGEAFADSVPADSVPAEPAAPEPVRYHPQTLDPPAPPVALLGPESWRPAAEPLGSTDEDALLGEAQHAQRVGDSARALTAARRCLELFPQSVEALQIAALEYAREGRWLELAQLYASLVEALADAGNAAQLCGAAARVYREQLGDEEGARRILARGLELAPSNANVLLELAELEHRRGDPALAAEYCRRALENHPLSARTARAACERFLQVGRSDMARNAALILSYLGQQGPEAALLASGLPEALPQPTRALGAAEFALGLDLFGCEPELVQLFAQLYEPLRELTLGKAKDQQRLLASLKAEDIEQSTTTLTRALGWTCRFLSVQPPAVYLAEGEGLPEPLPVTQIAWGVGKGLGRGSSLAELAFIWGRALGRARPESRILLACPTLKRHCQLADAVRVALQLPGDYEAEAKQLGKSLKKRLPPAVQQLAPRIGQFSQEQLYHAVERFRLRAELAANRVGLVACGDLGVAVRTATRFPCAPELSREAQVEDLFAYAFGNAHGELRHRLGLG